MKVVISFLLLACLAACVRGHGYLVDPAGRASAWRFGFDVPKDYDDNACFCGGFWYQYSVNDGKCGICGDPWDKVNREHEVGSIYATGILTQNYTRGQVIKVTVDVTANHRGHFEYKICANNDVTVEATQECLDMTPLYPVGKDDYFLYIGTTRGYVSHELQLPEDLICSQCVLQWRYVAGNNWGVCKNGTQDVGCGPQEEFRGCADVAILDTARDEGIMLDLNPAVKDEGIMLDLNPAVKDEGIMLDLNPAVKDEGIMLDLNPAVKDVKEGGKTIVEEYRKE